MISIIMYFYYNVAEATRTFYITWSHRINKFIAGMILLTFISPEIHNNYIDQINEQFRKNEIERAKYIFIDLGFSLDK